MKMSGDKDEHDALNRKLLLLKGKNNTSQFKATSREKYQQAFANRTKTPGVGLYNPHKERLLQKSYDPHINVEHSTEREAVNLKLELNKKATKLCDHISRVIIPPPVVKRNTLVNT